MTDLLQIYSHAMSRTRPFASGSWWITLHSCINFRKWEGSTRKGRTLADENFFTFYNLQEKNMAWSSDMQVQALRNASVALAVKINSAPHQPQTDSAGSATNNGPSSAASNILLDEMIEPSTAVTYKKP